MLRKKNVEENYAENLFDQIEKFAGYGFNRSHSVGYALIAYQTAWLKSHYPSEFMSSVLSCEMDNTDRIQVFVDDCKMLNLTVKKPDINTSIYEFKDENESTILYGLGAIKGIGKSLVESIITERNKGSFSSLIDFCIRVGSNKINSRILTTLIGSGAMDAIGTREDLFSQIDPTLRKAEQVSERTESNMGDLFGEHEEVIAIDNQANKEEKRDILLAEWNSLGFYLESHPIESKKAEVRKMCGFFISELHTEIHPQRVAGMLMHLNVRQGKRGRFAFATLDDSTGRLEVSIWAENFDKYRNLLKKGQLIVVEGVVERDSYSDNRSFKMVTNRVLSFDQARAEYIKEIKVSVDNEFTKTVDLTKEIMPLLTNNGGNRLVFSYSTKEASGNIKLPEKYSFEVNDINLNKLKTICGESNVEFVYHSRNHVN